jgi:SpoIVB peptidase S55
MKRVERSLFVRAGAAVAALALGVTGLAAGPVAAQVSGPIDCPEITPTDEITAGMQATGFTVSEGTEPEPFDAEVLGVLRNGVAPGRDMIVVETSSPAIDTAGGIWFGMSGSPVYDETGRLLGAVAFGLTGGPSHIGGLTPAEDLDELLDFPSSQTAAAAGSVELSGNLERKVAARTEGDRTDFKFRRLRAPLSVSGLTDRGYETLAKAIRREGGNYVLSQGSSAPVPETESAQTTLGAGDTFGAAQSYGDISFGGIGTTSMVCDDKAIAFGHPFGWTGRTELGANEALTLGIVSDPLFGPFKLATMTEQVGFVDQDRLAGIRALLGPGPQLRAIDSSVSVPHLNRSQDGNSRAVTDDIVPTIAFYHLFGHIDTTFDTIGEGNSQVEWTVTGTTEDGDPWTLNRTNLYSSNFDISTESSFEVMNQLASVLDNKFTEIDFTGVSMDATVNEGRSGYRIAKVLHSRNGRRFTSGRRVVVRPGSNLFLRVRLENVAEGPDRRADLKLKVPARFRAAELVVAGGSVSGDFLCFLDFGSCSSGVGKQKSFDDLIAALEDAPKNNELTATLFRSRSKEPRSATRALDGVVRGSRFLLVFAKGGGGGSHSLSPGLSR